MLFFVFVAALVWDIFAEEFKNGGCRIPFIGIWKKPSKLAHCSFPSFQHISFRNHQSIECIIVKVNFSLTLSCKSWIIFIVLAPDKMYIHKWATSSSTIVMVRCFDEYKSHCAMCGSHLVPSSINFPWESPKVFSLFPLSLSQHKRKRALSVSKLLSKFKQYEGTLAATCDNILIKSHTKRKTKTKYLKKWTFRYVIKSPSTALFLQFQSCLAFLGFHLKKRWSNKSWSGKGNIKKWKWSPLSGKNPLSSFCATMK